MSSNVHFSAQKKVKTKTKKQVITSTYVHFSAPKLVKIEKKRSSHLQAVVCTETFQDFSWKNNLTCFHCS